jgi:hypothetical protein
MPMPGSSLPCLEKALGTRLGILDCIGREKAWSGEEIEAGTEGEETKGRRQETYLLISKTT